MRATLYCWKCQLTWDYCPLSAKATSWWALVATRFYSSFSGSRSHPSFFYFFEFYFSFFFRRWQSRAHAWPAVWVTSGWVRRRKNFVDAPAENNELIHSRIDWEPLGLLPVRDMSGAQRGSHLFFFFEILWIISSQLRHLFSHSHFDPVNHPSVRRLSRWSLRLDPFGVCTSRSPWALRRTVVSHGERFLSRHIWTSRGQISYWRPHCN